MATRFVAILLLAVAPRCGASPSRHSASTSPRGSDDPVAGEVFCYRLSFPYRDVVRVIGKAGGASEAVFRDKATVKLKITAEDLEGFERLVAEARLPVDGQGESVRKVGELSGPCLDGMLRLTRDGSSREFRIVETHKTARLVDWLWRVMNEAACLRRLRDGDPDDVGFFLPGATPGPDGVLHLGAFREPLQRLLESPVPRVREVAARALKSLPEPDLAR